MYLYIMLINLLHHVTVQFAVHFGLEMQDLSMAITFELFTSIDDLIYIFKHPQVPDQQEYLFIQLGNLSLIVLIILFFIQLLKTTKYLLLKYTGDKQVCVVDVNVSLHTLTIKYR